MDFNGLKEMLANRKSGFDISAEGRIGVVIGICNIASKLGIASVRLNTCAGLLPLMSGAS